MQKCGVIYSRRTQKKLLLKKSRAQSRLLPHLPGLKFFILLASILILWSNITRIADSININEQNIVGNLSLSALVAPLVPTLTPTITPTPTATPTPTPTPVILPSRLIVDKLGIDTEIEYVGVDDNGKMGVPSNWDNVAWYRAGPVPGQTGNVVIAGHFDTNRGKPAVFFRLESLEPGDIIRVSKVDGSLFDYRVTRMEIFPYNEVPVDYIFRSQEGSQLVLITCNGYFNRGIQSYSHRIAVFAELL